jgi:hypothetical protein
MQHGAVLNIGFLANANAMHIAADDGRKPNGAAPAENYVAYDGGIVGHKTVGGDGWRNAVNGKDESGHKVVCMVSFPS